MLLGGCLYCAAEPLLVYSWKFVLIAPGLFEFLLDSWEVLPVVVASPPLWPMIIVGEADDSFTLWLDLWAFFKSLRESLLCEAPVVLPEFGCGFVLP